MESIFMSYFKTDKEIAFNIYEDLKRNGYSPWLDEKDILPGQIWEEEIEKAIHKSGIFIACISQRSVTSRSYMHAELKSALKVYNTLPSDHAFIIPVRIDDCELPNELSKFQAVKYFEADGPDRLISAIKQHLAKRATVASLPTNNAISLLTQKPLMIGVDVGTTKIAAGLISLSNKNIPNILLRQRVKHDDIGDKVGILDRIESVIRSLVSEAKIDIKDIERIGIGLPGQVDFSTGLLKFAPGLKLHNINVRTNLTQRLQRPVYTDNDVNCSTLAELHFGYGLSLKNFVCIFIGTGIGGGIVIENKIVRGSSYSAGEIGHMKIDCGINARLCNCGAKGCFEEYSSARAILRLAREKIFKVQERKEESLLRDLDANTVQPEDIVNIIEKRDTASIDLAKEIASFLAIGIANVANILNPDAIILGGGIIEGFFEFDFFHTLFHDEFKKHTLDACANTQIHPSTFKHNTPIIGAVALTLN